MYSGSWTMINIDLKLREFLHMHNGEFAAFTKNWVAEDEQTSFYEFYAEKKWEEVLSNHKHKQQKT